MTRQTLPPTLRFLIAARQAELHSLESLAHTCELVTLISHLVHELQKERGYTNLFLCHPTPERQHILDAQHQSVSTHEADVRTFLDALLTHPIGSDHGRARLFDSIAHALYRLDGLPILRCNILAHRLQPGDASAAFTRLISSLLAVAVETTDAAHDADITRLLAALLNFMQGKELCGQERAYGVLGYTAGRFNPTQKVHMAMLAERQTRCFMQFEALADRQSLQAWQSLDDLHEPVLSLRGMAARTSAEQPVDTGMAALWFDLCTTRIDGMHPIECQLTTTLAQRCRQRIEAVSLDLRNHRALLDSMAAHEGSTRPTMLFDVQSRPLDVAPADGIASGMERSILDLLQAQAERIQASDQALDQARTALDERRHIEKAKWILVKLHRISEADAHAQLQHEAMRSGRTLTEVAHALLATRNATQG
ncbi:ANTAR domain-containing protein [Alcaligenaceae bacterium SJ-26]|nr:ANTAR domain-containing protein [Alcaligenaceae bacterium SJ-26]